jgi:hypothetical protein
MFGVFTLRLNLESGILKKLPQQRFVGPVIYFVGRQQK